MKQYTTDKQCGTAFRWLVCVICLVMLSIAMGVSNDAPAGFTMLGVGGILFSIVGGLISLPNND